MYMIFPSGLNARKVQIRGIILLKFSFTTFYFYKDC